MMTEREAWLHVAALWKKAIPTYGDYYKAEGASGICSNFRRLWQEGKITFETYDVTCFKIRMVRPNDAYKWPLDVTGRDARISFCLEQARLLEVVEVPLPPGRDH